MLRSLILALTAFGATTATAEVTSARYTDPTDRYGHAVLGDAIEWGGLEVTTENGQRFKLTLPETRVFEDIEPRLIATPDGRVLVMVVETEVSTGARLSLYDESGLVAATPHIGRTNRWLAPIGAADLDGDGALEVAYVDRPHLAKTIRIWRLSDAGLAPVADLPGFTNHRIGEDTIAGGIRECGTGPQMVVADARWRDVFAIGWDGTTFQINPVGPHEGRSSFAKALDCR